MGNVEEKRPLKVSQSPSHWLGAGWEVMVGVRLSEWFADVLTDYNKVFSEGLGDFTTRDIEERTGHQARSFETFAGDFAERFVPATTTL